MPAALRILQIMRAPVGGLFRHVVDLTEGLAARGHQIGVVVDSGASDAATEAKLARLEKSAILGIHRVPIPRTFGAGDLTAPRKVKALAERLDIQVLHGHGAKGGFNARLTRAISPGRIALYTPHGGVLHFSPKSLQGRVFKQLERSMMRWTDAIVFESDFARRAFAAQIAAPSCPAPVIHNGLAEPEFVLVPLAPDAHDFVFIGELRDLKGVHVLLDALVPLKGADGRPATLIIAGDGQDRAAIEQRIAAPDLADRVTLAGVQPARSMLALGRCLVVPSLAESLPYVVLEGAAAGRPVISTQVGGIAEIFGPTANRLVPPNDVGALRNAMQDVIDNPNTAQAEADDRRAFVHEHFSADGMVEKIETLYLSLMAQR